MCVYLHQGLCVCFLKAMCMKYTQPEINIVLTDIFFRSFSFCHHLFILRARQYVCMWEEKFWILFVTWSCMKEVEKGNSVPCFFL